MVVLVGVMRADGRGMVYGGGWMGLGLGKCLFVLSVIVLRKGFKLNKYFNFYTTLPYPTPPHSI